MPDFGFGGPQFGIRDGKGGTWVGDGTWGPTMIDIPSIQMLSVRAETISGELTGDDVITDSQSKIIAGMMTMRWGGVSIDVIQLLTGRTPTSSGTTPRRSRRIRVTGENMQYIGLCGKVNASQGSGDTHFFIPKTKCMEGFELRAEYGAYVIPEITMRAVPDDLYSIEGASEVQTATITGTPTGGTFTLTFYGRDTSAIAYNATGATVETALLALGVLNLGDVEVTGGAGGPYVVTFAENFANTALDILEAAHAFTGGTTPDIAVVETTAGVEVIPTIFEVVEHESSTPVALPPL